MIGEQYSIMKRIFFSLLLSITFLIIFLLISEAFFRIFRGAPEISLAKTTQKDKRYLGKPNSAAYHKSDFPGEFAYTAHFNNFGYRGKDFSMPKKEGSVRIFLVGDSFTYGVGSEDEETISSRMEEKLRGQNIDIEVINAGAGHSSPIIHYNNLKNIHLQYGPDLVILLLDMTDLRDDWEFGRHAIYNKQGEIIAFDPLSINGKRHWWRTCVHYSAFCKWFHDKILRLFNKISLLGFKGYIKIKRQGMHAKGAIAISEDIASEEVILRHDNLIFLRGRERQKLIEKYWKKCTAQHLMRIKRLLADTGIPFIITMYPYGIQVGKEQWARGRIILGFEAGKIYTDRYSFELVESFAQQNDIPFINTLDNFLQAEEKQFFFDYDGHLTPEGNKVLAQAIIENKAFKDILNRIGQSR